METFITINDAVTAFVELLQPSEEDSHDPIGAIDKSSAKIRLGFDLMLNRNFFDIISAYHLENKSLQSKLSLTVQCLATNPVSTTPP
jgi:hypothetical protein